MTKHSGYIDSVGWAIKKYLSILASEEFQYEGVLFKPILLKVSPLISRDVDCPEMCGACCGAGLKSSLDYIPSEDHNLPDIERREISIIHPSGERKVEVYTDWQKNSLGSVCRYLRPSDGRCDAYPQRPFSCDLPLIMSNIRGDRSSATLLTRHFGRHWSLKRITGEKGTLCKIKDPSFEAKAGVIRKLMRMKEWMVHFGFDTERIKTIIQWLEYKRIPTETLVIEPRKEKK